MPKTILIIEDEAPIREMLHVVLKQANFHVISAENAKKAFEYLLKQSPDLILLDWMLPGMSGIDVAHLLKANEETAKIPIIMLTARATEDNKVQGFESGIDDYLVKPFSPRELIARIKAILRRTEKIGLSSPIIVGNLTIDPNTESVTIEKKPIKLNSTEYRLLLFFSTAPEKIYTRLQLLNHVWPHSSDLDERAVDAAIKRLRQALGPQLFHLVKTVRGKGYYFSTRNTDA